MPRGRTARSLAGLAAAALLVCGCGAETHKAATLPPVSSPAASSTQALPPLGPPDLPMPAAARQRTADGFNEFTKYYISLINRLDDDLDPTYLRQFSRNCRDCTRIADDAADDAAKGRHYVGGHMTITALAPAHFMGDQAETAFMIDQGAYTVFDSSGVPVPGLTDKPALLGMSSGTFGEWVGDHWIVTELTLG